MKAKVISRILGGLGNQLFCYSAARRLALANDTELVIDHISGFVRDYQYRRKYLLDSFNIKARKTTPSERLEPFERYRRCVIKWFSRRKPFNTRCYLEQEGYDFDERLLKLCVQGVLYLDGLWQSEKYFKDIEDTIRIDFQIKPPTDELNLSISREIRNCQAVAVHVRWFDAAGATETHNASPDYYRRAVEIIERKVRSPRYFIFSDDPKAARSKLALPEGKVSYISHNLGDENAYADLWLMTQCRHFIIANSTFSWWGAWLGEEKEKIIISPGLELEGKSGWGFKGLIPDTWLKV
jgi:hypothetical protein